ncbi:ORF6N domain-containing protein [Salmonella enterica]|nr:ORF6N domain-containing protein [Salmonella enterica]EDX4099678.1 ORF6N domain-containing protein [Salmonella enterica]EGG4252099.1 ORF6N domain-containing protein [Salmonella enterica]EGG4259702.1 ORF6N domain-containing protein [Salmonella enterica]EGG4288328.1 ORF6N domain-containing protein [Salmonella enterica]
MTKAISVHNSRIPLVEYQGQRVVTFAMVDKAHQRPEGTAKAAFNRNRHRFIEDRHFFALTGYVLRTQSFSSIFPARTRKGILITEMGYMLLVKPFNDDLSWKIQEELITAYFRHFPQFPELQEVHIPDAKDLAAMPLKEAQNLLAIADRESFTEHGQKGSAGMRLRREELKKLRPALCLIGEQSQLNLPGAAHE